VWRRRKTDDNWPMTNRRFQKTANEIASYGYERFTGWAH
jgi:hypothetical protein